MKTEEIYCLFNVSKRNLVRGKIAGNARDPRCNLICAEMEDIQLSPAFKRKCFEALII